MFGLGTLVRMTIEAVKTLFKRRLNLILAGMSIFSGVLLQQLRVQGADTELKQTSFIHHTPATSSETKQRQTFSERTFTNSHHHHTSHHHHNHHQSRNLLHNGNTKSSSGFWFSSNSLGTTGSFHLDFKYFWKLGLGFCLIQN